MIKQKENKEKVIKSCKNRVALFVVIICTIVAISALAILMRTQFSTHATTTVTTASEKIERVAIAIEGMSCSGCANGIQAMLRRTEGVASADVSYERKEAIVEYNAERTTREKLVEVVNNMGYKASVKD
jgi:copper chaperone CopZ